MNLHLPFMDDEVNKYKCQHRVKATVYIQILIHVHLYEMAFYFGLKFHHIKKNFQDLFRE